MGSQHIYDVASTTDHSTNASKTLGIPSSTIEVALNPEDLTEGLDNETLKRKFDLEQSAVKAQAAAQQEDFSDLVAEHAQKQAKKRQRKDDGSKYKDFKF